MALLVFSTLPGLGVAGRLHPQAASHPLDEFSEAQLRELAADRHITLAVGELVTPDEIIAHAAKPAPGAAKGKASA